jgi:protein-S-isoprenylcysteine O-methyltransferase Ste14
MRLSHFLTTDLPLHFDFVSQSILRYHDRQPEHTLEVDQHMFILVRALVYASLFIGFGLVFLPSRILSRTGIMAPAEIGAAQIGAMVLTAAGMLLVLSSILAFVFVGKGTAAPFDPPRRLVTTGPFRFVRNPIYIGAIAALGGAALYYGSVGLLLYALALAVGFHVLVLFYEEPVLRRTFGSEYDDYCRRVGRWLPQMSRQSATL